MEKQISQFIKLCMMVLLLVLAYVLPGICVERYRDTDIDRTEKKTQENLQESVDYEIAVQKNQQGSASHETVAWESLQKVAEYETFRKENYQEAADHEIFMQENQTKAADQETMAEKQRIVLDPGHGGNDPGMVGIGGVEEKLLNLELAMDLKALLEKEGFQVVMTRETDKSLADDGVSNKKAQDMQRRCAVIEEAAPVLTVSIHQNSYTDPAVCGPQVFYYAHSAEGEALAACVQEQLNQQLGIKRPREIKANTNYYILKRSSSVTILVECAFLSNPEEAALIQTEEYQQKTAEAIRNGILEYLENNVS